MLVRTNQFKAVKCLKKKKERLSFYINSNDFWQKQLAQNWLPKVQDTSKRQLLQESLVRMQVKLIKRMPITEATRWYVRQIDANNRFSSLTSKLDAIYANVPGIYSYELLSPGSIFVQNGTILYCYLLTALTEAIIENACESGTIDQLRTDLGKCQRIFQDAALFDDNTLINFVIALPYVVQSDVLEWDKVCTLWVSLFVCASKDFSNRIISLLNDVEDEIDVPSGTTAQTLYNITDATREQIKATLKPHLRAEWAECATDTTITHLALVFARLIKKTYGTIIMDKSLTKDEVRQGTENLPTKLKIQIISALNTNDHALIEEYFADQNADHNVCLFGLYHLACQNTLWLETWLGEITLAAEIYMSPQRLEILSYYGHDSSKGDLNNAIEEFFNTLFALTDCESALTTLDLHQFEPVFDAFYTPTAPADPLHTEEQVTMQQIFHCLGLRLYEPKYPPEKQLKGHSRNAWLDSRLCQIL